MFVARRTRWRAGEGLSPDGVDAVIQAVEKLGGAREVFRPPSGADWEKSGIVPDLAIPLDWDEFTAETDQQLLAARDWLLKIIL